MFLQHSVGEVAHTRLLSVGSRADPGFGSQPAGDMSHKPSIHYFLPGPQLPSQPLKGLLPVSLLGEQSHDGCEQFA